MIMRAEKHQRSGRGEPIVKVVDLCCGIGGLTHGLTLEGLDVVAGIDNDKSCKYPFEENNDSKFICRDISRFTVKELRRLFRGATVRVLVGCAPCQPYSSLNRKKLDQKEARRRLYPMYRFMTLIRRVKPEIVSMENVPDLSDAGKYPVFQEFVETLKVLGYAVFFERVDASRYGVPQKRNRLVLLASLLGEDITIIPETHAGDDIVTVQDAISTLPRLKDGEVDARDPLHRASKLTEINRKRIAATPRNGGSATSWPRHLVPTCYRRKTGRSYMVSVYGRMRWGAARPHDHDAVHDARNWKVWSSIAESRDIAERSGEIPNFSGLLPVRARQRSNDQKYRAAHRKRRSHSVGPSDRQEHQETRASSFQKPAQMSL